MEAHDVQEELEDDHDLDGSPGIALRHVGHQYRDDDFLPEDEKTEPRQWCDKMRSVVVELKPVDNETNLAHSVRFTVRRWNRDSDARTVFATRPVRKSLSIFSGTHSSPLLSIRLATRSQSGPAQISPRKAPTKPERKQSPICAVLKPKRLVTPKFRAKPAVLAISVIMHTDAQKAGKTTAGYANMANGRRNVWDHVSPVGFVGVRNPSRR